MTRIDFVCDCRASERNFLGCGSCKSIYEIELMLLYGTGLAEWSGIHEY